MATAKNTKNTYDSIIVGSGLSGLILARRLSNMGQKVLVLEKKDSLGGHLRSTSTNGFQFHTSLPYLPDFHEYTEPFEMLETLLERKILGPSKELPTKTFNSGELKDFIGFSDLKFHSIDEAQWYTQGKVREILVPPETWVECLLEDPHFETQTLHEVTRYNFDDGKFDSVTVNGTKTFYASNFFHAAPVSPLHILIPSAALKGKEKTKLSKAQGWTSVCLHFLHPGLQTENQNIHLLMGSKTDFEPCIGCFYPAVQLESKTLQESFWFSLINDEHTEDMEHIGALIRNMKKQIKRAYPEAIENIEIEKIVVTPQSQGSYSLDLKSPCQLSQISNFWLASPLLLEQRAMGASVQAASEAFNAWQVSQPKEVTTAESPA